MICGQRLLIRSEFNDASKNMPRAGTTATVIGYKLYPFSGGDEAGLYDINI